MNKNSALIVIDMINDIIHKDGKVPSSAEAVEKYKVIDKINKYTAEARKIGIPVIHVKVGFSDNYAEQPKNSPIFGQINKINALKLGTWGTEFHKDINITPTDITVIKHRISAFYNTDLEAVLMSEKIDTVIITGVSTNMAVELTAREAHDRDYKVVVLSDACASQSKENNDFALKILSRIAEIR